MLVHDGALWGEILAKKYKKFSGVQIRKRMFIGGVI